MGRYFRDGEPDWKRIEAMARRNWRRFMDMANEDLGFLGGGARVGRMLASGDLRLVALYLIAEQPRHGYDLIKAVEERARGFYAPSPGTVYPALTYLEEAGYVTSEPDGNKKLYTITEEGRAHLDENRRSVEQTLEFLARAGEQMHRFRDFARSGRETGEDEGRGPRPVWPFGAPPADEDEEIGAETLPDIKAARRELKAAVKSVRRAAPATQRRAADALRKAAAEIRTIASQEDFEG